jgi:3-dehydroquinate synthase
MASPDLRRIEVATAPPYTVFIGRGALSLLPEWLLENLPGRRLALVTDAAVDRLHGAAVRERLRSARIAVETVVVEPGEAHKTRRTKEQIEDVLIEAGISRDAAIVALGGGVVTDLGGFAAATYMRGIPWVAVPTTLLGMVDAAIGGKTGVNHPRGKNLIGALHQPAAVIADVDLLATLPEVEYRSGLAEVIKAGIIDDAVLFDLLAAEPARVLAREPALLEEVIARACEVKARVVAEDASEVDRRQILNFGHTVGHALEQVSGHAVRHGEAISIGMVAESRLAVGAGILDPAHAEAIEAAIAALGLPVRLTGPLPGLSVEALLEAARVDKKSRAGRIVCVFPRRIGTMARGERGHGIPLDEDLLREVVAGLGGPAGSP